MTQEAMPEADIACLAKNLHAIYRHVEAAGPARVLIEDFPAIPVWSLDKRAINLFRVRLEEPVHRPMAAWPDSKSSTFLLHV